MAHATWRTLRRVLFCKVIGTFMIRKMRVFKVRYDGPDSLQYWLGGEISAEWLMLTHPERIAESILWFECFGCNSSICVEESQTAWRVCSASSAVQQLNAQTWTVLGCERPSRSQLRKLLIMHNLPPVSGVVSTVFTDERPAQPSSDPHRSPS